jgi:HK97 family phage prohead protease
MTEMLEHATFEVDDIECRVKDEWNYVSLRAVPYEQEIALTPSRSEVFARGAFATATKGAGRVPFTLGHPLTPLERNQGDRIIGVMSSATDGADAFRADFKMARTARADEARALIEVGALREVSVGFSRTKGGTQTIQRDGGVLNRHIRAGLDHVALVRSGAYGDGAQVEAVRDDLMRIADLREILALRKLRVS